MSIVAIIPARWGATRLPGKPLSDIHGKPLVQHVYERVRLARRPQRVLVATDDERILSAVRSFGGEAVLTSPQHESGTDRLAEVARLLPEAAIVANVQGDEPLIDPAAIDAAIEPLLGPEGEGCAMSTLAVPLGSAEEMLAPSVVKVVTDGRGAALYFSRSPIPHWRTPEGGLPGAAAAAVAAGLALRHVGIYVYRREALLRFASLPPAPLERAEALEQLRALHHGMRIHVVRRAAASALAVDTPEDLERARRAMAPAAMMKTAGPEEDR